MHTFKAHHLKPGTAAIISFTTLSLSVSPVKTFKTANSTFIIHNKKGYMNITMYDGHVEVCRSWTYLKNGPILSWSTWYYSGLIK